MSTTISYYQQNEVLIFIADSLLASLLATVLYITNSYNIQLDGFQNCQAKSILFVKGISNLSWLKGKNSVWGLYTVHVCRCHYCASELQESHA